MREQDWKPIETAPEGRVVLTRIKDAAGERNVQTLRRQGRLFFMPGGMYVYYTPTHWAEPAAPSKQEQGS